MSCPSCGAGVPDGARFCPSCGTPVANRADERRVATVVFADLVGFTTLSESLDPEHVKAVVDRCFERVAAEVVAFGGQVDKIVGDGLIALFGASVAHGDDAERAVRAALAMQTAIDGVDHGGVVADGVVRMRVGVNTGEVLVGALRAGGTTTAMGDVVNVAQRLQTAAEPGQVLVGPETHAATVDAIRYDAIGEVAVRGREEPVTAWVALGATAPPGRRPRRSVLPLVGRDDEVALLTAAIDLAVNRSRPLVVVLDGEAGVGKSRLSEEVARQSAQRHCAVVLEGHCVPYGEANPFWPLATAVRSVLGREVVDAEQLPSLVGRLLGEGLDDRELARLAAGLAHLLGLPSPLDSIDPQRAAEEVSRTVLACLEAVVSTAPLTLVVSDLHWADERLLELLTRLVVQLSTRPFVLITTTRDSAAPEIVGRHDLLSLHLQPLRRDDAKALLDEVLAEVGDDELRERLLDRSGGNPFFLEELAALVGHTERRGAGAELPGTLRGLVLARLDALDPDARAVVDNAAVLGSSGLVLSLEKFAAALGQTVDAAIVDRLVAEGILDVDDGRWTFRSDSIREVAYQTLTKAARAERHVGVARSMAQHVDADAIAVAAAHHWTTAAELAGELGPLASLPPDLVDQAVEWSQRAAQVAMRRDAFPAAEAAADRALALLGSVGETDERARERRALLLARGGARAGGRHLAAAESDARAALALAASARDDRSARDHAEALTLLAEIHQNSGDLVAAERVGSEAVEAWREVADPMGLARALRVTGMTALFGFESARADAAFVEARAISVAHEDRRGRAWADQHLAWLSFLTGDVEQAEDRLTTAIATFEEVGDPGGRGWAVGLLAWVRFQQGRPDEAAELAETIRAEAVRRGDRWGEAMMIMLQANLRLWSGRASEAVVLALDARQRLRSLGDRYGEVLAMAPLSRAQAALGRDADVVRTMEEQRTIAESRGLGAFAAMTQASVGIHLGDARRVAAAGELVEGIERGDAFEPLVARGVVALLLDDLDTALACLEQAAELRPGHPYLMSTTALTLTALGRTRAAREAAEAAIVSPSSTYLDRIMARLALGLLGAAAGSVGDATVAFEAARAEADGTDDVVWRTIVRSIEAAALDCLGLPAAASVARRGIEDATLGGDWLRLARSILG